jgi:BirA family biotin operon repressor/biotin-[acetyl-CoA-carboxylase] ligase
MRLDPSVVAAGVRLVAHELLGSTNAEALRLAQSGERGPLWVTAGRQTGGRGRRGRNWVSEPGNLHATLLLTDPAPAERWPQLSFAAALAAFDAVATTAPVLAPRLAIKWPNDLLLGRAKVAGILVEGQSGSAAVAIGIGVNCVSHPPHTDYPATDLADTRVSAAALFEALSVAMLARLRQWSRGEGFPLTRADWLARAAGLGEDITARLPGRELRGRFEALDPTGALLLRLPDGRLATIAAGDVFPSTAVAAAG